MDFITLDNENGRVAGSDGCIWAEWGGGKEIMDACYTVGSFVIQQLMALIPLLFIHTWYVHGTIYILYSFSNL